jgi:hypothetical protein
MTFSGLKENLINVGARHLPHDAKYVMWADGDIEFDNPIGQWTRSTRFSITR